MKKKFALLCTVAAVAGAVSTAQAGGFPGAGFGSGRCGAGGGLGASFGVLEVVGLTADQRLICFNSKVPTLARAIGAVTGLTGDTKLVGIDFRPATGELYGLGNAGGVYTLSLGDATATFKSQLSNVALEGTFFGVDFNPTVDRLRVVSDSGQNLRINVDNGMTTEDADLNSNGAPVTGVAAAAYTNNDGNADTATTLFDIDSMLDQVAIQAPPNAGSLNPSGKLVVDTSGDVGFDIYSTVRGGRTLYNAAFASLTTTDGRARFYQINLLTGRAVLTGTFTSKNQVTDVALPLNQF